MAFPSFLPSNLSIPFSPSPPSSNPVSPSFPSRFSHLNLKSTLSTRPLQTFNDEESPPEADPSLDSTEIKKTKKKKKRKLRPSFYDQTLERWSLKISSQRTKFPWQEQAEKNLVGTHLHSGPNSLNSMRNRELDLIVGKLDGRLGEKSSDFDVDDEKRLQNPSKIIPPGISLGSHRAMAPWVHGAKPRDAQLDSKFDGETKNMNGSLNQDTSNSNQSSNLSNVNDEEIHDTVVQITESLEVSRESGKSKVRLIVEQLENSLDQKCPKLDVGIASNRSANEKFSNSNRDIVKLMASVPLPWERDDGGSGDDRFRKRSNTELAEKTIPEPELRRLRNDALRMKERMNVGAGGVTEAVVKIIHGKWKISEVVKLKFEGPPTLNMKRTHEALESKTGGIVIWRSGSSLVLYRGITYRLPCARLYSKLVDTMPTDNNLASSNDSAIDIVGNMKNGLVTDVDTTNSANPSEGSTDTFEIDSLLDQLGPRYKDWSGRNPLPVDADLLPGVIPDYKPPYRLLPCNTRSGLKDKQMTYLRRLARSMPPHFALGRNRQLQGLAKAMVKLWEKSVIAKIAIKRGVQATSNERMAEEIKKLTGGILLSRNKEFIVFYRGNGYLIPSIREVLMEKQTLVTVLQDKEEAARLKASSLIVSNAKAAKGPLVAGTLAETLEANTRWGNQPSSEDREKMMRDLALAKHASLVRYLERKLAFAKAKVRKAEKSLAKVQEFLNPAELPTDLEIVTDEERFLFRKMGLKMRAFLLLGRRGVFDGTVENMHLNWKHRELVKILVKGKSFAQVKHIAISLEAESGGVLVSVDKTSKGYAIIIYRGKNYHRPQILRPRNLLTRREALARAIELQRREALNHHISDLRKRIEILKSQLGKMEAAKELDSEHLDTKIDGTYMSDDDVEDEGEEAYLQTYISDDDVDHAT